MIGTTHFINAVVQRAAVDAGGGRCALASRSVTRCRHFATGRRTWRRSPKAPLPRWRAVLSTTAAPSCRSTRRPFAARRGKCASRACAPWRFRRFFRPSTTSTSSAPRRSSPRRCRTAAITMSSDLGRIGLLERENAALLNAALSELARDTIAAFNQAIRDSGIDAPALHHAERRHRGRGCTTAMRFPVYSFASGATNSMRGAAYLSQLDDAIVIDVGGTTTDVGPAQTGVSARIELGGQHRRRADAVSHAGLALVWARWRQSRVLWSRCKWGRFPWAIGLVSDGLVFGGEQLTATDVAVAAGLLDLGDAARVAHLDSAMRQPRARCLPRDD